MASRHGWVWGDRRAISLFITFRPVPESIALFAVIMERMSFTSGTQSGTEWARFCKASTGHLPCTIQAQYIGRKCWVFFFLYPAAAAGLATFSINFIARHAMGFQWLIPENFPPLNHAAEALTHMLNQDETKHSMNTYFDITWSRRRWMCRVHWHSKSSHISSWIHLRFCFGILQRSHLACPERRNASANERRKQVVAIHHSGVLN